MGGCATKPATLESEEVLAPVEAPAPLDAPAPVATEKAETAPQENENEDETKKEEPLIDVTDPAAAEAQQTKEVKKIAAEAKPIDEEAIFADSKPKEHGTEATDEKKEVQEIETPKETEIVGPKSEEVRTQ